MSGGHNETSRGVTSPKVLFFVIVIFWKFGGKLANLKVTIIAQRVPHLTIVLVTLEKERNEGKKQFLTGIGEQHHKRVKIFRSRESNRL